MDAVNSISFSSQSSDCEEPKDVVDALTSDDKTNNAPLITIVTAMVDELESGTMAHKGGFWVRFVSVVKRFRLEVLPNMFSAINDRELLLAENLLTLVFKLMKVG